MVRRRPFPRRDPLEQEGTTAGKLLRLLGRFYELLFRVAVRS
jgi:hypothetical protein